MTNPPLCPDHETPMKPSQDNLSWYCTKKTGPGPKDWCKRRVAIKAGPEAPQQPRRASIARHATPTPQGGLTSAQEASLRVQAASAAVNAACRFYAHTEAVETVEWFARRLYHTILLPALLGQAVQPAESAEPQPQDEEDLGF